MSAVKEAWDSFAVKAIPPDAPEEQYVGMRHAFYAGCWALLNLDRYALESFAAARAEGASMFALMERVRQELEQFQDDMA